MKNKKQIYNLIESGDLKGKKLLLPSLSTTRSTKSIVKACVFNVIRQDLRELIFIEAFGGSAMMAIEAISNNAFHSIAIEKDTKAYEIACKNAKSLERSNLQILKGDSFELLPALISKANKELLLYLDPPFDTRSGFENIYNKLYELIANLDQDKIFMLIIEHNSQNKSPQNIASFEKFKEKKFGNTSLSFYKK